MSSVSFGSCGFAADELDEAAGFELDCAAAELGFVLAELDFSGWLDVILDDIAVEEAGDTLDSTAAELDASKEECPPETDSEVLPAAPDVVVPSSDTEFGVVLLQEDNSTATASMVTAPNCNILVFIKNSLFPFIFSSAVFPAAAVMHRYILLISF